MKGGKLKDVKYGLEDADGNEYIGQGGFNITDGGFNKTTTFICPISDSFERAEVYFSEFLESIRKDIECVNALLKNRYES